MNDTPHPTSSPSFPSSPSLPLPSAPGAGGPARRATDRKGGGNLTPLSLTIDDLTAHLIWPKLLRAPRLALSPHRIGLSAGALAVIGLLDQLWASAAGMPMGPVGTVVSRMGEQVGHVVDRVMQLDAGGAGKAAARVFLDAPASMVRAGDGTFSWSGLFSLLVLVPVAVVVLGIAWGAVSRSVALEFASGRRVAWPALLGGAARRWGAGALGLLGPLLLGWALVAVVAAAGWMLLRTPYVDVVGALLFPLFIVAGVALALLFGGYLLACCLVVPCASCDHADGFDSASRAYAMAFNRPLWLVVYGVICVVQGVLAFVAIAVVVVLALAVLAWATGVPMDIGGVAPAAVVDGAAGAGRTAADPPAAHRIMTFWITLVRVLLAGYALSIVFSASTLLYLAMRRRLDGQDMAEVHEGG